jgi:hypothetical protein
VTTPKLTPALRRQLEAIEAAGGEMAGQGSAFRKLLDAGYLTCGRCSVAHTITDAGRKALADLAAKDAAAKAKPLSATEIYALKSADKYGSIVLVYSGMWSDFRGHGGSYGSATINRLIGRSLLKKLDADTVKLTDAGREALAKIKERT